tara:strand:+ start:327 stop:758 length:432 start_codon:yes stop_codon:yes gene_type:complete
MEYKYHKTNKICDWKRRGLLLRENESYDILYDKWVNVTNCEKCNVELVYGVGSNGRCLDHDHTSGYFRNILCNSCNHKRISPTGRKLNKKNTSGIPNIRQRVRGNCVDYIYEKKVNKVLHLKCFKTLEEAKVYKKNYEIKYIS